MSFLPLGKLGLSKVKFPRLATTYDGTVFVRTDPRTGAISLKICRESNASFGIFFFRPEAEMMDVAAFSIC